MKLRICAATAVGMLMLCACSSVTSARTVPTPASTGPSPVSAGELVTIPPVADVPKITDPTHDALPIERYLLSTSQEQAILTAQQVLITSCMARYGFKYDATESASDAAQGGSPTARRYGVVNMQEVERYGYHPPGPPGSGTSSNSALDNLPAEEDFVLTGGTGPDPEGSSTAQATAPAGNYDGKAVPAGGCAAESVRTLTAHGGSLDQPAAAEQINYNSFSSSMANPQVQQVFRLWSSCMDSKGYKYANPMAAVADPQWRTAAPSAAEIKTAEADVACKQATNLIGVWFTVESAIQNREIQQNARQLASAEHGIDAEVSAAEQIVRRG